MGLRRIASAGSASALATVIAACGFLGLVDAPDDCGFPIDSRIDWSGQASAEQLGFQLQGPPDVSPEDVGDVYVTTRRDDGDRGICIVYRQGGQVEWVVAPAVSADWQPPPTR